MPVTDIAGSNTIRVSRGTTRRVVIAVGIAHFINDAYSSFISPLLPRLMDHLEMSIADGCASMAMTWSLAASLIQPAAGYLADRYGRKLFVIGGPSDFRRLSLAHRTCSVRRGIGPDRDRWRDRQRGVSSAGCRHVWGSRGREGEWPADVHFRVRWVTRIRGRTADGGRSGGRGRPERDVGGYDTSDRRVRATPQDSSGGSAPS